MNNNITIIGNVGQQPEMRMTPSGMQVLEFSVATTFGKDDKKQTTWHNVTVFGKMAENVASSVQKGNRVIVIGRLDISTSEKDGQKRTYTKVIADNVGLDLSFARAFVDQSEKTVEMVGKAFNAKPADTYTAEEPF